MNMAQNRFLKCPPALIQTFFVRAGAGNLHHTKKDPSNIVTGRVADVRPYIERAAAYIVPLRIGGGTRLKIYEAMAMEKAIVSTTIGAEGLPVKNGGDLLLADTAESFAEAVIRVLEDKALASDLGNRAAATVRSKFGWERVAECFGRICEDTLVRDRTGKVMCPTIGGSTIKQSKRVRPVAETQ